MLSSDAAQLVKTSNNLRTFFLFFRKIKTKRANCFNYAIFNKIQNFEKYTSITDPLEFGRLHYYD